MGVKFWNAVCTWYIHWHGAAVAVVLVLCEVSPLFRLQVKTLGCVEEEAA